MIESRITYAVEGKTEKLPFYVKIVLLIILEFINKMI